MVSRKPSSLFAKSNQSSPQHSAASSRSSSSHRSRSWDLSDKEDMSSEDLPRQSLAVAIPQASGSYCHRRPGLKEILSNQSSPPWTLAAFMAYLSANLCLENLEFTMDAGRYTKHYNKLMLKADSDGLPPAKDSEYVRLLWVRLIDAYIAPNGSREVNLPSSVRDPILNAPTLPMPPKPETLDIAVAKTYELMEESVLLPFLNSLGPQSSTSCQDRSQYPDHQTDYYSRSRRNRDSPPPHYDAYSSSAPVGRGLPPRSRFANAKSSSSGSGLSTTVSNTSDTSLNRNNWSHNSGQDDSGSTDSPTNDVPMTPPLSPPVSELSTSSKHNRDSGMWKRLGRFSGITGHKKKSSSISDEPQRHD